MNDLSGGTATAISVRAEERFGFVDLTDQLRAAIASSFLEEGLCIAFCRHTTCGLLINEWEDGAQEDLLRRLDVLVPPGAYYAHDDLTRRTQNLVPDERANGRAHVLQMIVGGNSQVVPVAGGMPLLGRWQRLFMLELDEPRDRQIILQTTGVYNENRRDVPTLDGCNLERSR